MLNTAKEFMTYTTHLRGFTIVELLIVIVVIGILAAITIVAFSGVTTRANDAAVQSDLKNAAQRFHNYLTETGNVPTSSYVTAGSLDIKITKSAYSLGNAGGRNFGICAVTSPGVQKFGIVALTANSTRYSYTSTEGLKKFTSAFPANSADLCTALGMSSVETGAWTTWGAETGQPNGWYTWVKS
jgi:prepilin-type N-terminal cleavage/methylation domain-containing protein